MGHRPSLGSYDARSSGGEAYAHASASEESVSPYAPAEPYPPYVPPAQAITQLTAAAVADADRRDNYLNYISRHPNEHLSAGIDMTRRVRIHVVDGQGQPVHDAQILVQSPEGGSHGRTHADGIWDYFPSVDSPSGFGTANVRVTTGDQQESMTIELPRSGDGQDVVFRLSNTEASRPHVLDLGFAIDVTGSMEDELRYVNAEISTIVHRIRAATPNITIRVGAVFYRDRFDSVPVAQIPFTTDVPRFAASMQRIRAEGGGDYPEDLNRGLESALGDLNWSEREGAARILVLIADAPPQHYPDAQFTYHDAMRQAAGHGIRILPAAASGADRNVEALFRAMGAYTSTPYVYLTDDSGLGDAHMEADTDRVGIELFANLLTRLVIDDLRGHGMHEPGALGPARQ